MIKNIRKKLTDEQKERGVIFSSCLSVARTELLNDTVHEVKKTDNDQNETMIRLSDNSFFRNSHFKYNIIRGF